MNKRAFNIVSMLLSLLCGGLIYLLFRPEAYVSVFFNGFIALDGLRSSLSFVSCDLINYYLVDYLWGYALCCGFVAVFLPQKQNLPCCVSAGFGLGVVWEVLQSFDAVNGTGDMIDILMYLLAALSAIFVNLKEKEK